MRFVEGYEHDVFVSYAHVDDMTLPGVDTGWVTTLVDALQTRLIQKLGRPEYLSLWMDHELSGHESITDQLLNKVTSAATLVVVLSPGYAASPWCRREKDTFLDKIKDRVRSGSRVFIVERDQVEPEDRPEEFGDLKGYRFWERPRRGEPVRIFGYPTPKADDLAYYDRLEELCTALAGELKQLKAAAGRDRDVPARRGNGEQRDNGHPGVLLAVTTDDLETRRGEVERYLSQAGVRVLPDSEYPLDPGAFEEALVADLAKAKLFVQLLSEIPGRKWQELPQGYVRYQYELAVEAGIPILQWRNRSVEVNAVDDAEHRRMLDLETVRAEGIEEFKRAIRERAFEERKVKDEKPLQAFVFVDSDVNDRSLAESVCDELVEMGVDVCLPITEGEPAAIREDLERNLIECNALVIVYGASTVGWVHEQLRQCRKVLAKRDRVLKALAVYQGPPEGKPGVTFRMRNLSVLDCSRGVDSQALKSFLSRID